MQTNVLLFVFVLVELPVKVVLLYSLMSDLNSDEQ